MASVPERLIAVVILLLALMQPPDASAHGDLHLRILALTSQIQAATNNPARLYLERGELHREHLNWEEALADYDRAAQLDPSLAGLDLCRARLLADLGKLEAARAMFDQAVRQTPSDGQGYIGRARVWLRLGQPAPAIEDYRQGVQRLSRPEPEPYLEWAQSLAGQGRTNEALNALDAGIARLGPVLMLQGYALDLELARQDRESALARIDTLIQVANRKETWLARKGEILLGLGRTVEAKACFDTSLAAVKRLPPRLQQSPSMVALQSRVQAALAAMTNAPSSGPLN